MTGAPRWVCPDDGTELDEPIGTVASCPECMRAYVCATKEERERSLARIAAAKKKPIGHGIV